MALNEQQAADLQAGTGQFQGYVPISSESDYVANQEAWKNASPLGVQEYNGSLYGVTPDTSLLENIPDESETLTPNDTKLATGGFTDTFYDEAAKSFGEDMSRYERLRLAAMEQMQRSNEARIREQEAEQTKAAAGLEEWTKYNIDEKVESFKEDIEYKQLVDNLNDIEQQSADAWKEYQDLSNAVKRNPNVSHSFSVGMQGKYKEDYLAEATYLAMQADIAQGNVDRIDKRVDRYYTQVSDMRNRMIDNFDSVLTMSKQNIFNLEDKEESYILETLDVLNAKEEKDAAERDSKRELWRFAIQSNVDPTTAGLNMQDDYETMMSKLYPIIKERQDLEFNMIHSGDGVGGSVNTGYPSDVTGYNEKLAYDTAREIVILEGPEGFTDEDWNRHVTNFIEKSKTNYSEAEASKLLAEGLTRYKREQKIPQSQKDSGDVLGSDIEVEKTEYEKGQETREMLPYLPEAAMETASSPFSWFLNRASEVQKIRNERFRGFLNK